MRQKESTSSGLRSRNTTTSSKCVDTHPTWHRSRRDQVPDPCQAGPINRSPGRPAGAPGEDTSAYLMLIFAFGAASVFGSFTVSRPFS
jgi:hypothetical protein